MQASVQLVDDRGRKYLTVDERARFLRTAAHVKKPADQTFVLTIAHTGARVSEVLALRALDVDLDAGAVRIRTLKRRVEHWREVPVPPELARDLEMVHYLREASPRRVKEPLWPLSRATAHRKVVAVMRTAGIDERPIALPLAPPGAVFRPRRGPRVPGLADRRRCRGRIPVTGRASSFRVRPGRVAVGVQSARLSGVGEGLDQRAHVPGAAGADVAEGGGHHDGDAQSDACLHAGLSAHEVPFETEVVIDPPIDPLEGGAAPVASPSAPVPPGTAWAASPPGCSSPRRTPGSPSTPPEARRPCRRSGGSGTRTRPCRASPPAGAGPGRLTCRPASSKPGTSARSHAPVAPCRHTPDAPRSRAARPAGPRAALSPGPEGPDAGA